MTWKQIEASREIRLWFGQVIVPAAIAVGTVLTISEARQAATEKVNNIKTSVKNIFTKKN